LRGVSTSRRTAGLAVGRALAVRFMFPNGFWGKIVADLRFHVDDIVNRDFFPMVLCKFHCRTLSLKLIIKCSLLSALVCLLFAVLP
jgi:hypothetical protein